MDTFKGQYNDRLRELCSENYCEVAIIPHNWTNKFQPLDIGVNKAAKVFIQNMYNEWFSNEVATQLNGGVDPTEAKITSKLSDLKSLHASWIVDLYQPLKKETGMIIKVSIPPGLQRLLIMLNLFTLRENWKSFSKSLNLLEFTLFFLFSFFLQFPSDHS